MFLARIGLLLLLSYSGLSQETGTLVFYRTDHSYKPSIFCDGLELGRLQAKHYFDVAAAVGEHTCTVEKLENQKEAVIITVTPGSRTFLKVHYGFRYHLEVVTPEAGSSEMVNLLPADREWVFKNSLARNSQLNTVQPIESLRPDPNSPVSVQTPPQDRGLELKGYWVGMSLADFRNIRTGTVWIEPNGKKAKRMETGLPLCSDQFRATEMEPKAGEVICYTSMVERGIEAATFAGRRSVANSYTFRGGKLAIIQVSFKPADYETILEAFSAKFGPPEMSSESYQNGFGATWQGRVAKWTKNGSTLLLQEGPGNGPAQDESIHPSQVVLASDQEFARDKPKIDF